MESKLKIETGSLEAVGRDNNLPAAPTHGFFLCFSDQTTTKTTPAKRFSIATDYRRVRDYRYLHQNTAQRLVG